MLNIPHAQGIFGGLGIPPPSPSSHPVSPTLFLLAPSSGYWDGDAFLCFWVGVRRPPPLPLASSLGLLFWDALGRLWDALECWDAGNMKAKP